MNAKKTNKTTRIISFFLMMVLCINHLSVNALAEADSGNETEKGYINTGSINDYEEDIIEEDSMPDEETADSVISEESIWLAAEEIETALEEVSKRAVQALNYKRLYKQNDTSTWTSEYANSGCILFSFANAIYCLNGQEVDVIELGTWAKSIGAWKPGNGGGIRGTFYKNVESKFGSKYGFKITDQGTYSSVNNSTLKNHLQNGGVAVGHVTNHFIALVDYDSSSDKFFVVDSYVYSARGLPAAGWVTSNYLQTHTDATVDWFALISSKVPSKPAITSITANSSSEITINWGKVSGATSYEIRRKKSGDGEGWEYYKKVGTSTGTSYKDTGLESGTRYAYGVVAINSSGNSGNPGADNRKGIYTLTDKPKVTSVTALSSSQLKVNWNAVNGAVSYEVYRRKPGEWVSWEETYEKIGSVTGTEYTDSGLAPNTKYHYGIVAINGSGAGSGNPGSENRNNGTTLVTGSEMASGYDRVLPDGDYRIVSAVDPGYYLDIPGVDVPAAKGSNVEIHGPATGNLAPSDIWTITYSDGFYTICQKGTTVALDVTGGNKDIGTNVEVWQRNNNSNQKWAISVISMSEKGYRIQSKCSGMSLDITGGNITSGTNVQQYTGNTSNAQRWLFIPYEPGRPVADGRYMLVSGMNPHVELDVPGNTGDISDGTSAQIWDDGTNNRFNSFDVRYVGNGYYNLVHAASGKYLGVEGATVDNYGDIQLFAPDGSNSQKWCIVAQNSGYMLVNRHSGLVMDVDNGHTENATNVRQHFYNGSNAQTWVFKQAEYSIEYDANGGTGAPSAQTKYYANDITLSTEEPSFENRIFKGWATEKDAEEAQYQPGAIYTADNDIVLYAVWEEPEVDLVLPTMLRQIEEEAFEGTSFRCVRIGEDVETIGNRAFADCDELRYVYIPEKTSYIAPDAFEGTSGLTIIGKDGSYAEQYAQAYGYSFITSMK